MPFDLIDSVVQRSAGILFAAFCFCCTPTAEAQSGLQNPTPLAAVCAKRDLEVFTQIERHGEDQDVPAARLAMATAALMTARKTCQHGRVETAMAIYDLINPAVMLVEHRPSHAP